MTACDPLLGSVLVRTLTPLTSPVVCFPLRVDTDKYLLAAKVVFSLRYNGTAIRYNGDLLVYPP